MVKITRSPSARLKNTSNPGLGLGIYVPKRAKPLGLGSSQDALDMQQHRVTHLGHLGAMRTKKKFLFNEMAIAD